LLFDMLADASCALSLDHPVTALRHVL
jgi:hypothetical protein